MTKDTRNLRIYFKYTFLEIFFQYKRIWKILVPRATRVNWSLIYPRGLMPFQMCFDKDSLLSLSEYRWKDISCFYLCQNSFGKMSVCTDEGDQYKQFMFCTRLLPAYVLITRHTYHIYIYYISTYIDLYILYACIYIIQFRQCPRLVQRIGLKIHSEERVRILI